jgi:hypothetical protein
MGAGVKSMTFVQLSKIIREERVEGEDDSIEFVSTAVPVRVAVSAIRCFNPRKPGRGAGTRLTFTDGGGYAVTETFPEVEALLGLLPEDVQPVRPARGRRPAAVETPDASA